jgi:hypothetical protein
MPALPPSATDERALLKALRNHAEFRRILSDLSLTSDLASFDQQIEGVVKCWFGLAETHLHEAKAAESSGNSRSAFSRAYYAAYNASKAVRYRVTGFVSLKGDDHERAAAELPDDFPSVATWSATISALYEHRLRADYDNWRDTASEQTMLSSACIAEAEKFIADCRTYLGSKFGIAL